MRPVPPETIELIKRSEGYSPNLYKCPAGLETFGYGSLLRNYPNTLFPIDEDFATACLENDLCKFAKAVGALIKVPLTDGQYAALLDFTYNLGPGTLQRSTLRSKLNRGEYDEASKELLRYVRGGGRVLPGLVKRRKAEYELFHS